MDFDAKKPTHLFALIAVLGSLLLFVGYPLISIFLSTDIPTLYPSSMTAFERITFEVFLLVFQLLFVFAGLILVPVLWYMLVNHLTLREMFNRLQLRRQGLSNALLWGFITIGIAFAITMVIGYTYLYFTKTDPTSVSNIPDLLQLFSVPSLYLLVILQPFCEEFFFRGFLLEKITKCSSPLVAVLGTSILFGISHLSYTYAYTALIATILGMLLALLVVKTKNLYAAIFAHTVINVASLSLFFFGKSFGM
jgi:membrane protease YdiL (CAAX protease family)